MGVPRALALDRDFLPSRTSRAWMPGRPICSSFRRL